MDNLGSHDPGADGICDGFGPFIRKRDVEHGRLHSISALDSPSGERGPGNRRGC